AVIDPGDEVLLFDPAYETYQTCIELARGVPVCLSSNSEFYFPT
uniref:Aminotransferase class I/classII domain-containing protein n=1 Tax=Aegilops tauschii subsp. strangulata TaxID=200361 RepID=A0A452YGQ7_AEGTS